MRLLRMLILSLVNVLGNIAEDSQGHQKNDNYFDTCSLSKITLNENETFSGQDPKAFASNPFVLRYNRIHFQCMRCAGSDDLHTLVIKNYYQSLKPKQRKSVCNPSCNGLLCGNSTCIGLDRLANNSKLGKSDIKKYCAGSRIAKKTPKESSSSSASSENNKVQIIVGFAVGGTMLAIVIVGVVFGRSRNNSSSNESDPGATPVSMSYSEWISNFSTGGRGSKASNLRVQETEGDINNVDNGAVPVYNIVYEGNNSSSATHLCGNDSQPVIIEVDDFESIESDSFMTSKEKDISSQNFTDNFVQSFENIPSKDSNSNHQLIEPGFSDHQLNYFTQILKTANTQKENVSVYIKDNEGTSLKTDSCNMSNNDFYSANTGYAANFENGSSQFETWSDESDNEQVNANPACDHVLTATTITCTGFSNKPHTKMALNLSDSNTPIKSFDQVNVAHLKHVFADVHRNTPRILQEKTNNENKRSHNQHLNPYGPSFPKGVFDAKPNVNFLTIHKEKLKSY